MPAVEVYDDHNHDHLPSESRQSNSDNDLFYKLPAKNLKISPKTESESFVKVPGIPFTWESCPGTPKHTFDEEIVLPPLTPPPSYLFPGKMTSGDHGKDKKCRFSRSIFSRIVFLKPARVLAKSLESSSAASSSMSSSYSMTPTPKDHFGSREKGFRDSGSAAISKVDEKSGEVAAGSVSVVSGEKAGGGGKTRRRFQPMKSMKKALSVIVAGRSKA